MKHYFTACQALLLPAPQVHHEVMLDASELAEKIRTAMDAAGLSSADLARAMNVSQQVVYQWRKTGRIAKGRLQQLATILKRPVGYFLDDDFASPDQGDMTIRELAEETGLSPEEIYAAAVAVASGKQGRTALGSKTPARMPVKRGLKKAG